MATYYGAYNTVSGLVISCGNLLVGMVFDTGVGWLPWACLAVTGLLCAGSVIGLERGGHLRAAPVPAPPDGRNRRAAPTAMKDTNALVRAHPPLSTR